MLEVGFEELDNDFVTIWSRKILGYGLNSLYDDIRKLAELGQINAIQSYYLVKDEKTINQKIDAYLKPVNYQTTYDYNLSIALAHSYTEAREKYYSNIVHYLNSFGEIDSNCQYEFYDVDGCRHVGNEIDFICTNCSIELSYKAALHLRSFYKITRNPLFLERALEIEQGVYLHTSLGDRLEARRELIKLYKKDPENPQVAFALGKCLVFNGKTKKSKELGTAILGKLACRELSDTLRVYKGNYDQKVAKTQNGADSEVPKLACGELIK